MNFVRKIACLIVALGAGLIPLAASAQSQPNSIESILVSQQGGEVLVQVTECGVCHSDVHIHDGYFGLGGEAKLDVRADPNTRNEVIYLKHAAAKDVATILTQLVTGQNNAARQQMIQANLRLVVRIDLPWL